jgi:hypothetical protein
LTQVQYFFFTMTQRIRSFVSQNHLNHEQILENNQFNINTRSRKNGFFSMMSLFFVSNSEFLCLLNSLKSRFTGEHEEIGEELFHDLNPVPHSVEISKSDFDLLAERKPACSALSKRIFSLRADTSSSFNMILHLASDRAFSLNDDVGDNDFDILFC